MLTFVSLCLFREQFLKANAQLTFRCRQLLYELSYIYPIDVVSWGYMSSPAQHISNYRQLQRIICCQNWGFDNVKITQIRGSYFSRMLFLLIQSRCSSHIYFVTSVIQMKYSNSIFSGYTLLLFPSLNPAACTRCSFHYNVCSL